VHEKAKPVACGVNAGEKVVHALRGNGEAREVGSLALKFREEGEWGHVGLFARRKDVVVAERGWSGLSKS
jgi:hypothetical protein